MARWIVGALLPLPLVSYCQPFYLTFNREKMFRDLGFGRWYSGILIRANLFSVFILFEIFYSGICIRASYPEPLECPWNSTNFLLFTEKFWRTSKDGQYCFSKKKTFLRKEKNSLENPWKSLALLFGNPPDTLFLVGKVSCRRVFVFLYS